MFSRLAGGEYFLVAYYDPDLMESSGIKSKSLNISPTFLSVTMEHVDRQLDPGFQVTSFRVGGGLLNNLLELRLLIQRYSVFPNVFTCILLSVFVRELF